MPLIPHRLPPNFGKIGFFFPSKYLNFLEKIYFIELFVREVITTR